MKRRHFMSDHCYPDKINIQQLFEEIDKGREPFIINMRNLGNTDDRYIEEWMKLFCDWMEIFDANEK